jgi:hypothetical protein
MADVETRQELTGQEIKTLISTITDTPRMCGFEVYVITKSEPRLKKMGFVENSADNLLQKLKESILKILSEKYNAADAAYVSADRIADEQRKFYIISTSENYDPLSVLKTTPGTFSKNDIGDATGIAFSVRHGEKHLWAYQHLWSIMVPNKSRKNWMARMVSGTQGDVFEEMTDPIITFAEKIDLLVIDDHIIASDYKLLQNSFGFQDYIRIRADKTIEAVDAKGIVANVDKLRDYVQRGNGKPKYAKKMMRITDSKVLKMEPEKLWENIHRSIRWNGKIKEENGKFVLDTYTQVEDLIDLLDERYTRSDITDTEYDTDVKQVAEPVTGGTQ